MRTKYKKSGTKKSIALAIALLSCTALLLTVLEMTHTTNFFRSNPRSGHTGEQDAKTTSDAPSAQPDFTTDDNREPSASTNKPEVTVSDTQGRIATKPPQNEWTVSQSKVVTVYGPAANSILTSGATISGSSSLDQVSFRLIDDISGVISQGQLKVVNGSFSGTFSFSTNASTGRLDVFSTRADGVEQNNIEIPVRFK